MERLNNVDMSAYTSFKAGGKVASLVIVETPEELVSVMNEIGDGDYLLLGNGSNTIFACEEYKGIVVKLGDSFDYIEVKGARITCGGATLLSRLSKAAAAESLTGLEFAGGIPGSVGGAVFMNAGAYDGEIKDVLKEISVLMPMDGVWQECTLDADSLELSYRHSKLMENKAILLKAVFQLTPGNKDEIFDKMKDFAQRRSDKQPLEYPSAGSFFKRPPGMFAGKLIEDAGLKGFSVGGAQVSEKHAGFVINKGGATYKDILELMAHVQAKVKEDFQVELEPEVRIITQE